MRFLRVIFFAPFSLIWYLIARLKRLSYKWKLRKRTDSYIYSIVVGNISMGGTGKTPMSVYLLKLAMERGFSIGYLSRGYGRKTSGLRQVRLDSTTKEVGDEALLVKRRFPKAEVIVCESRVEGMKYFEQKGKVDWVLLDDAFQHLSYKASTYLMLSDMNRPFFKDWVFPSGTLREPRGYHKEADAVLFTKAKKDLNLATKEQFIKKVRSEVPVLFSSVAYASRPKSVFKAKQLNWTNKTRVLAFSGLANNEPFFQFLNEKFKLLGTVDFADHHDFKENDFESIKLTYEAQKKVDMNQSLAMITTEKDAVRIQTSPYNGILQDLPLYYWPIEVVFSEKDNLELQRLIFTIDEK